MAWFDRDILDFFAELEANNEREWFERNKKQYERSVKEPMTLFAAEMIGRLQKIDPSISMMPKDAVFRIYRDIRFSKDKTPYKTNAGMYISPSGPDHTGRVHSGRVHTGRPGMYFHVDARRMGIASGYYTPTPEQVHAIRTHISANPEDFERCLADSEFVTAFGTIAGEKNKVLPQEFRAAAQAQPLLFLKQFYYWAEHPATDALREDLPEVIVRHFKAAQPMNAFLTGAFPEA